MNLSKSLGGGNGNARGKEGENKEGKKQGRKDDRKRGGGVIGGGGERNVNFFSLC